VKIFNAPSKPTLELSPSRAGPSCDPAQTPMQRSQLRAWCNLVRLGISRQARVRQMVWIALALLALTAVVVTLPRLAGGWGMARWRSRWPAPPLSHLTPSPPPAFLGRGKREESLPPSTMLSSPRWVVSTFEETASGFETLPALPASRPALALENAVALAFRVNLSQSGFYVFSTWIVFSLFVSFLLPIWSLSFASEALGGEQEGHTLIWLLTRPLPRSSIYLAKFVALLPWSLALNLGGFSLLCFLAGSPGREALRLYWPAVTAATLAFSALFHLLSACFRRAAVVGLVYAFFLETVFGSLPGYMKRLSIGFYTRCLMFEAAHEHGLEAVKPSVYLPVSAGVAWWVLLSITAVLLMVGMIVFARSEYADLA
jgi:ABC-type transport system involved in multi-copper enzyme maturation permease subunit